jgi:hypothetical protein
LVIAQGGDVERLLEHRALVPEVDVHGLDRDPSGLGDLAQSCREIAVLGEHLDGGGDDSTPCGSGLVAAARCGELAPLDFVFHSLHSDFRVPLQRTARAPIAVFFDSLQ